MNSISVALPVPGTAVDLPQFLRLTEFFASQSFVRRILVLHPEPNCPAQVQEELKCPDKREFIAVDSWISARTISRILGAAVGDGLLLKLSQVDLEFDRRALDALMELAGLFKAGLVYSDRTQVSRGEVRERQVLDYQPGSIRESFDFGPVVLLSKRGAEDALEKHGPVSRDVRWGGFYDLRLKLSIENPIVRVGEPLYVEHAPVPGPENESSGEGLCMPPRDDRDYQREAEQVATLHLRRIGAYVDSGSCAPPVSGDPFPVTASIIIPTRNRGVTLGQALESAVTQRASFVYNVIVVDDHSTDRTAEIIEQFAAENGCIVHIIPDRLHLGIGGLWNEAIYSTQCGQYAIQLDSDDVFATDGAVEMLVNEFTGGSPNPQRRSTPRYAMVVGSYTPVNFHLDPLPQGLNQRLELSPENGRNNLLCLDGTGAPRAFYVPVVRRLGFANVSYGEDYALGLRIAREYDIGRIFEPLYLSRRWAENTSRTLPFGAVKSISVKDMTPPSCSQQEFLSRIRSITGPLVAASAYRYDSYKDYLRTVEIQARKTRNQVIA